jgi:hypothetical protein
VGQLAPARARASYKTGNILLIVGALTPQVGKIIGVLLLNTGDAPFAVAVGVATDLLALVLLVIGLTFTVATFLRRRRPLSN